jgi:hypothetical protein
VTPGSERLVGHMLVGGGAAGNKGWGKIVLIACKQIRYTFRKLRVQVFLVDSWTDLIRTTAGM